jgi:hypothetical protein
MSALYTHCRFGRIFVALGVFALGLLSATPVLPVSASIEASATVVLPVSIYPSSTSLSTSHEDNTFAVRSPSEGLLLLTVEYSDGSDVTIPVQTVFPEDTTPGSGATCQLMQSQIEDTDLSGDSVRVVTLIYTEN